MWNDRIWRHRAIVGITGAWLPIIGGCDLRDAAVDGVFGGISTTISTVMSTLLLDLFAGLGL